MWIPRTPNTDSHFAKCLGRLRERIQTPSLRFPLRAGGTKRGMARFPSRSRAANQALMRFPSRSGGANQALMRFPSRSGVANQAPTRFPSRSGGNLKEGGNS